MDPIWILNVESMEMKRERGLAAGRPKFLIFDISEKIKSSEKNT